MDNKKPIILSNQEEWNFTDYIDSLIQKEETLTQYRQLFANLKPSHPWPNLNDLEFLTKLEAYRKDRQDKEEGFTLAGILMFGKTESITDPECAPDYFPDYREHLKQPTKIPINKIT